MKKIKCYAVPIDKPLDGWMRYTDDGAGSMRDDCIVFGSGPEYAENADWLFVGHSAYSCFYTRIPKERRVLFLMEPPGVAVYPLKYLEQFGAVVSPYDIPSYSGRIVRGNPCIGWFAGATLFATPHDVLAWPKPHKTHELSMITSLKGQLPDRKKRIALMDALRHEFGTRFDAFGREFAPLDDKLDGIANYKYHIAVENSRIPFYWTEKLADAWIGWALPIYCGDPAILDQIPDKRGIELIDVDDIGGTIEKIRTILDDDPYESRLDAIKKCRDWAIAMSDPCERMCSVIETADDRTICAQRLDHDEMIRIFLNGRKGALLNAIDFVFGKDVGDKAMLSYCRRKGWI